MNKYKKLFTSQCSQLVEKISFHFLPNTTLGLRLKRETKTRQKGQSYIWEICINKGYLQKSGRQTFNRLLKKGNAWKTK